MTTRSSLSRASTRAPRLFVLAVLALVGSVIATSCLTPEATFTDDGPNSSIGGASGDGDGDGDGDGQPTDHCNNRIVDADETDNDCGGRDCDPCELGRTCEAAADCVNDMCTMGICQMASCTDSIKNSSETDVDCGGEGCPPCADDKRCLANMDCESVSCKGGFCAAPTCKDRIKNGTESDIDCGGDCGTCDPGSVCLLKADCSQPPEGDPSTTVCEDGICTLICAEGQGDCNNDASDGCEVTLSVDLNHCGECGSTCSPDNAAAAKCIGGACEIDFENGGCRAGWLDCNGMHEDGCEVNSNTDPNNCGGCGATHACSSANGTPSCSGGTCSINCDSGFDDCDSDARGNGCEVNTDINATMCGDCDTDCPDGSSTQSPNCVAGTCGLTNCDAGLGDCDGDGSCTDNLNTVTNCGGCGIVCEAANGNVACVDQGGGNFQCEVSSCNGNFRNCDGLYSNGCESNSKTDVTNCGGCAADVGQNCISIRDGNATISQIECNSGSCKITSCSGSNQDCNGATGDGCEVNTATDDTRCGGCNPAGGVGVNCTTSWANGNGDCQSSACVFTGCSSSNWGDCENGLTDGCETDLRVNKNHCGSCGSRCVDDDGYTSSNSCSSKQCNATCNSSGAKCDANEWNGCENVATSTNNCGTCGNICGGSGQSGVASASCAAKSCNVTCDNGMCPDATAAAACTVPLGTTSNCSFCGEVCSGQNNICTATGCKDHLPLVVVGTLNIVGTGNSNKTSSYTMATTSSTTRGLILATNAVRNAGADITAKITWNGGANEAAMTLAFRQVINSAEAAIFYLNNASLPPSGTAINVVTSSTDTWGGLVATLIEVKDMYQAGNPVTDTKGTNNLTDCQPSISISRNAAVAYEDSLIVATVMAQGGTGTGTPTNVTEVHDAFTNNQAHGMVGYLENATAQTTVGFSAITGCWDTAIATATFRPYAP